MLNLAQKLTNVQKLELTILQLYYKNSQYNTSFKEDVLMLITSDLKRINNTNQCYIAVVNEIKQLFINKYIDQNYFLILQNLAKKRQTLAKLINTTLNKLLNLVGLSLLPQELEQIYLSKLLLEFYYYFYYNPKQYQVDEEQALYSFIIFLLETKGITGELVLINDDKQYQLLNKHVLDLLAVAPQVEKLALLISDVIDMISLDEHLIFSKELRKSIEEISQHNSMHQLITILKKINSIL